MYDNNPITFLNLRHLPARVDYNGAGVLLNFDPVAVRALVEMGYLKPLGNPKGTEHKYFSTATIQKLAQDEKWLGEATRALNKYWASKNGRKTGVRHDLSTTMPEAANASQIPLPHSRSSVRSFTGKHQS